MHEAHAPLKKVKKKMKTLSVLVLLLLPNISYTQPKGKAQEIFDLVNLARTNPDYFLNEYKAELQHYQPKFITFLEKASPALPAVWDNHLADNCKQIVYGDLSPEYTGTNRLCTIAEVKGRGSQRKEALYFVCSFYTSVMNKDDKYFGFYIDEEGHASSWGGTCTPTRVAYQFEGIVDSSKVDFDLLRTAENETYLSSMDKEVIKEVNFVRQYPKVYATILTEYLEKRAKSSRGLSTEEYTAALELVNELKQAQPARVLYPSECLYLSSRKHGLDSQGRGYMDHTGSDGSSPFSRIATYCNGARGNENLVGGRKDARALVIQLLVDTGISSRGHRYNMLDPYWQYIGVFGYQGVDMYYYVQNFSNN